MVFDTKYIDSIGISGSTLIIYLISKELLKYDYPDTETARAVYQDLKTRMESEDLKEEEQVNYVDVEKSYMILAAACLALMTFILLRNLM